MARNLALKLPTLGMHYIGQYMTQNHTYSWDYYLTYPTLPEESTHLYNFELKFLERHSQ